MTTFISENIAYKVLNLDGSCYHGGNGGVASAQEWGTWLMDATYYRTIDTL